MARQGADKLSNQELLAVLFSSGDVSHTISEITEALLAAFDGNLKELFCATIEQLTQVGGIGFSEACKIKAAFELGKRASAYWEADTVVVKSTDDVVPLVLSDMIFLKQEQFRVILLDSAVAHAAASLILVHNHPSGDPEPSKHDVLLTQKLCMCGKVLGIEVLDHVVIGGSGYVSLKKRNLM